MPNIRPKYSVPGSSRARVRRQCDAEIVHEAIFRPVNARMVASAWKRSCCFGSMSRRRNPRANSSRHAATGMALVEKRNSVAPDAGTAIGGSIPVASLPFCTIGR
jgi:hypothetical protein